MNFGENAQENFLHFHGIRQQSLRLTDNLTTEDMAGQSMPDASPTKWHLAHTTWFFETFLLLPHYRGYHPFNPYFQQLFNSNYDAVGARYPRPERGLLTRPSLQEVLSYRSYVEEHLGSLINNSNNDTIRQLFTIALHHEMQHQEAMLADVLNLLSHNPQHPEIRTPFTAPPGRFHMFKMKEFEGGLVDAGTSSEAFSYDCERPRFKTFLTPFALGSRLITNSEWLEFINDRAYQNSQLWLSDGWDCVNTHQWQAPLYWRCIDGAWFEYSFQGLMPLNGNAPVCHISFYEADAFARWANKRLPREHELEYCAQQTPIEGNFLENHAWRPMASDDVVDMNQIHGDAWEWTQSAFLPYPNFHPTQGALREYNGKFMVNQMVLKGGSCVTPRGLLRPSYRNYLRPHQRWQFSGLRLADDIQA
jgi:ergothioneine biosynthesis protein EgtB